MSEIAAAIRKVQKHCAGRIEKARPSTKGFAERASGENEPDSQRAESLMRSTSQL
jgi:hypothetical protein